MLHIRVTKKEDGSVKLELMDGQLKVRTVTRNEVLDMALQFMSSLRHEE